jgi:hypothetical protein
MHPSGTGGLAAAIVVDGGCGAAGAGVAGEGVSEGAGVAAGAGAASAGVETEVCIGASVPPVSGWDADASAEADAAGDCGRAIADLDAPGATGAASTTGAASPATTVVEECTTM